MPFDKNLYLDAVVNGDILSLSQQLAWAKQERVDSNILSQGFVMFGNLDPMMTYVEDTCDQIASLLKSTGADVNYKAAQGVPPPMECAAVKGNIRTLKALHKAGGKVDVNVVWRAVLGGHLESCRFVLGHFQGQLTQTDKNSFLRDAISYGHSAIAILLLDTYNTLPDNDSIEFAKNILQSFKEYRKNGVVNQFLRDLIQGCPDFSISIDSHIIHSDFNFALLHNAKAVLKKAGPSSDYSPQELNFNEREFYGAVVTFRGDKVAAILEEGPADIINHPFLNSDTPLLAAIKYPSSIAGPAAKKKMIQLLLLHGASPHVFDGNGKSALELAVELDDEIKGWLRDPSTVKNNRLPAPKPVEGVSDLRPILGVSSGASKRPLNDDRTQKNDIPSMSMSVAYSKAELSSPIKLPTGETKNVAPKIPYRGLKILSLIALSLSCIALVITIPLLFVTIPVLIDAIRNPVPSKDNYLGGGISHRFLNPHSPYVERTNLSVSGSGKLRVIPPCRSVMIVDTGPSVTASPIAAKRMSIALGAPEISPSAVNNPSLPFKISPSSLGSPK